MKNSLLLICLIILATGLPGFAQESPKLGIGFFGGVNIPVIQEDQSKGSEFGFKVRYGLGSLIVVEPYMSFVKWGEPDPFEGYQLASGSKLTAFGVEASLGNKPGLVGISPYFVAGVGSFKVKNDDTGYDESGFGWTGGLGLGVGLSPSLALDLKGRVIVAPVGSGGSKKGVSIVGGVNYTFGTGM